MLEKPIAAQNTSQSLNPTQTAIHPATIANHPIMLKITTFSPSKKELDFCLFMKLKLNRRLCT